MLIDPNSPSGLRLAGVFCRELGVAGKKHQNPKTLAEWAEVMGGILAASGMAYDEFREMLIWALRDHDRYGNPFTADNLRMAALARDPVNAVRSFERQFDNIVIHWTIKKKLLEEEGFEEWLDEQEYVWVDEAFADLYAEDWQCPDCLALPCREDDDQMLCLDCWDEANEPDSSESCLTPEWEGSTFVEHDITKAWDD